MSFCSFSFLEKLTCVVKFRQHLSTPQLLIFLKHKKLLEQMKIITNQPHTYMKIEEISVNTITRVEQNLFSKSEGQQR